MRGAATTGPLGDVPCPFCGLACDDLTIDAGGPVPRVAAAGCTLARAGFERTSGDPTPRLDGKPAALDAAIARAAAILAGSRQPLFAGLAADVAGVGAALQLADRLGGVVDHAGSAALFRNLPVQRELGWIATTLSEVRNRADLVLLVGPDPLAAVPRFVERCVAPAETLFETAPLARRLVRLGPPAPPPALPGHVSLTDIACPLEALPAAIAALRCLVAGLPVAATAIDASALTGLAEALGQARYATVAWSAAALALPQADLLVQGLSELVRTLNEKGRAAVLPLAGADNLIGANQACLWQTGQPLRTGFGRGHPEHDPALYAADRLLATREADALVWISAFRPGPIPAADGIPTIALAAAPVDAAVSPAVLIPVGTPGLDHPGRIFRTDGVVALQLRAVRQSRLPSVAEILARIDRAIGERP
jgi:formylmethanofuran dehydrogenase subunit B